MVSETTAMVLAEGHKHTMALDQSALLEVLEALKAAEVDDRIRQAAETIYQALIEAELSSVIGAWQRHLGGGEPVDHADRLVLWQLAAAYRVSNEPEGAVDFDVVTPGGTRSCPLVDDCNSTVHAGPGQGCRLAVIAFRPAAEFGLVVGESDDLLDFGQLDYLDPRQADGGGEGGML